LPGRAEQPPDPDDPMPNRSDNPIVLKNRRSVFRNTKFQVFADHIADARGVEVKDYLVVAPLPQREAMVTGAVIVPVCEGRVVLLRIYRHAVGRFALEAPRGFIDERESPAQAALRELEEETGLTCLPDDLIPLGFIAPEPTTFMVRVALFAALNCRPAGRIDEEEIGLGAQVRLPLAEVETLVRDMAVEDASTALALHRFLMRQGK
jgi:ADP-ribose pyrophosphatase